MKLDVDYAKCVRCGACVRDCPRGILVLPPEGAPEVNPNLADGCMDCQHCVCVCPKQALTVNGHNPKDAVVAPKGMPTPLSLLTMMKMRRSYRHYKPENVPENQLRILKDMLAYPPTGCNVQKLHYSFIFDREKMEKFRWLTFEALDHATADSKDPRAGHFRDILALNEKGRDVLFCSAPHMVVVSCSPEIPCPEADPFIALSYFELLAQSMGLGTLWCGLLKWTFQLAPELKRHLRMPEGNEVKYVMLFGVPDVRYFRAVQRGPISMSEIE